MTIDTQKIADEVEFALKHISGDSPTRQTFCALLDVIKAMGEALGKLSVDSYDWSGDCDGQLAYDDWVLITAKKPLTLAAPLMKLKGE